MELVEGPPASRRDSSPEEPSLAESSRGRVEQLLKEHYDFLWRTVRRHGLPPAAADDALQQVFLVASRRIAEIAAGAEKAFLYRTAMLIVLDLRRRHKRDPVRPSDAEIADVADPSEGPDELADRKRARAILDEVVRGMDDELREVFVLFELDEMPVPEIASLLDIPPGTCASRLRRAREAFKEAIKRLRAKDDFAMKRTHARSR